MRQIFGLIFQKCRIRNLLTYKELMYWFARIIKVISFSKLDGYLTDILYSSPLFYYSILYFYAQFSRVHTILEAATLLNFTNDRTNKQRGNKESRRAETVLNQSTNYRVFTDAHIRGLHPPHLKPPTVSTSIVSQALRFKLGKRASNRALTVYCYNFRHTFTVVYGGEEEITGKETFPPKFWFFHWYR